MVDVDVFSAWEWGLNRFKALNKNHDESSAKKSRTINVLAPLHMHIDDPIYLLKNDRIYIDTRNEDQWVDNASINLRLDVELNRDELSYL